MNDVTQPIRPQVAYVTQDLNPALQQVVDELKQQRTICAKNHLLFMRSLGLKIRAITANESLYGSNAVGYLAMELGISSSNAYKAQKFVELYTSDDDFEELLAAGTTNDGHLQLSWGHVVHLLPVADPEERLQLVRQIATEQLSTRGIGHARPTVHTSKERGKRPLVLPKTPQLALLDLSRVSTSWLRRFSEVWAHPKHGVFDRLADLEEVGDDVIAGLQRVIEEQEQLAAAAKQTVTKAKATLARLRPNKPIGKRMVAPPLPAEEELYAGLDDSAEDPFDEAYDGMSEEEFDPYDGHLSEEDASEVVEAAMRRGF